MTPINRLMASRGLLQIFCALLLVIVIMVVSNYIVYKNSISGIYDKVTQNNRLVIKNIIQSFDSSFAAVNNLIFAVHGLPYDLESPDKSIDMAKAYTLQEHIARLASSIDYIEDVIVFYDNLDLTVTAKGTSDFNVLFDKKYKHDTYSAKYWRMFASSKHEQTVFPITDFAVMADGLTRRTQQLMAVSDGNKVRLSNKNVMVLLNAERLLKQMDLKSMIPGASLVVLDANRNVVLSTDKSQDPSDILDEVYFSPDKEATLTRKNFEYNFYKSEYNDFIYINKVPYQFQNIGSVEAANHMIMISAIISAVLLSALLSVYLYRPVKDILKLFGGGHVKGNDFRKIYSGIVKVQAENESLRAAMDFADKELRRGVFLQMLDGYSYSRELEMQLQKHYAFFFPERQFVMAALQMKPPAAGDSQPGRPIEEIASMMDEGLRTAGPAAVFYTGHLEFVALVAIRQPSMRKVVIECLENFVKRAVKEELQGHELWACVSKLYDAKTAHCHEAYQDIKNARLYRNINAERSVVDLETIRYVSQIHFPFERIEKLSNTLLSGKSDEAMSILLEIVQENTERGIHLHQFAHIAKSIFYYLMKHTDSSAASSKESFQLETAFCRKVDNAYSCGEVTEALQTVVQWIGSRRLQEGKSKLNPEFITQYIELHYMDNLYLDHMAEVLNTSPKYFSNYFKKTFGVGYVDYLNKIRLSHAREYLKQTELSVAEIGEKTGYLNASTFTTTFKKYYGISPSEFRKKPGG
ncbi:helix-turn-helix transcriptional regulator [Paenibacillus sp. GCM10023248]|uniref:AraC family transcriptional regulator n=1 Tax=Bacillales TaxID=1385 RepID=UPI00237805D4|nr:MULTISPECIES: AraC family transcriptional regulator [Bacillales]MDD9269080.1 AraC family transcriptional regulator [Paenibacillus sp. MAHUQ-63]MDR6880699.1 AraC-like DNA-binding protein [Bacillus sp. 3255]